MSVSPNGSWVVVESRGVSGSSRRYLALIPGLVYRLPAHPKARL